ncbi:diacylglycerol/lipid kinase family protein [Paratissierella segnis]|uniref:Diacylglycerol kinase family lipid kinase n=1 Tax=Paratissierella segnis TaxID=2763679 RepID=A0A926IIU4_9FIRM|nr:diacylglycerol kinase family protein [Paratissierella segnis]MBC8586726.1 diacylglycerol kinase family lipid kinase [Paratissierella segnis]
MRNILFIVNPIAGGGRTKEIVPIITERMTENNIEYKIIYTKRPKEAINISEENVDKFSVIVAVGGDGTINEVAKGIINKKKGILGIIPGGTGNDMSKSLGLSQNPIEALDAIIENTTKNIDIGIVNGTLFLNIASIGFDAETVKNTEVIKKRIKGKIAYILSVLITLFTYRRRDISLIIDGKEYQRNFLLIAVGNGSYYGGGMKILPMAEIDDGYFHVCIIKDIKNCMVPFLFPSIFKGNHLRYSKYVDIFKANKVIIKNESNVIINLDGELMNNDKKDIVFDFMDYKLEVITNGFKY